SHGRAQHLGVAALELASRGDGKSQIAPLDGSDRDGRGRRLGRGRGSSREAAIQSADGGRRDDRHRNEEFPVRFHFGSAGGSVRVTRSPALSPFTATSSGLRASISISRATYFLFDAI